MHKIHHKEKSVLLKLIYLLNCIAKNATRKIMNIRDIFAFLHLCESCHFGKTAEAMHITPSTLSRQIQRLEEEFQTTLFSRDNRTVQCTENGEKMQIYAQQILNSYQELQCALKKNTEQIEGEIRLFCSVTAAYSHLPDVLDQFRRLYPQIEIKLTTGDAADAVEMIQTNQADLAIAGKPEKLSKSIFFKKFDEISIQLYAPMNNFVINQAINKSNWKEIPLIVPQYGPSRVLVNKWLKQKKIHSAQIWSEVAGHEAILSMIALGCGAALLPSVVYAHSAESLKKKIHVYNVNLPSFDLGFCVQKKRLDEPVIHAFWQLFSD